ncbi:MAG TPA: AMP-binding protein, partial [Ktedonobacteraceae bacterium]
MKEAVRCASGADRDLAVCTLVDILRWRALHQPDRRAFIYLGDGETEEASLTYAQLDRQARAVAASLQAHTRPGERALLLYQPGLDYIAAFLGCLYAGVIAVPAYPPSSLRSFPRIQSIAADAQATLALTSRALLPKMEQACAQLPDLGSLRWLSSDGADARQEEAWQAPALLPHMLTFLQYTSGSTGNPRGVMVSHANLLHNSAMMQQRWAHTPQSVGISWLPMFHDMGLIAGVLQPLYAGFLAVLMAPAAFIQRPGRWLEAISRYHGTTSWAPNFAYELCLRRVSEQEQALLDLSTWRIAGNGAEPLRLATLERFSQRFSACGFRHEAFTPGYGLAEGTLMVASSAAGQAPTVCHVERAALEQHRVLPQASASSATRTLVGCGGAAADQCVVIVHPETHQLCACDEVGEIWLAGPSVAQGYWGRAQETRAIFQAHLAGSAQGPFLRTGDLGFLHGGEVFITGRVKDIVIIRGRNHYPQDIELTVEQAHPVLRAGCGAAFAVEVLHEERLVVVQEVARTFQQSAELWRCIRQAVAAQHEVQIQCIVLLRAGSIPKTSSGKIQRRACREAFLAGTLAVVARDELAEEQRALPESQMSRASLLALPVEQQRASLQRYLCALLSGGQAASRLEPETPLVAAALDSLQALQVSAQLARDLQVTLPFVELLGDGTLASLLEQVSVQLQMAPAAHPSAALLPQGTQRYPLSFAQEQLWILSQLQPQSSAYHIPIAL